MDIEEICRQCQIDPRFESHLTGKLKESGFLKFDGYFKRAREESSDYIVVNGLGLGTLKGTYGLNIANEESESFEELLDAAQNRVDETGLGLAAAFVTLVASIPLTFLAYKITMLLTGNAYSADTISATVGWANMGLGTPLAIGYAGFIMPKKIQRQSAREIEEKGYLKNALHSDKSFDYRTIEKILQRE
jgi:hypothetical protein